MADHQPLPISATELRKRLRTVRQVAKRLGFLGRVDYLHIHGNTGGAQYGRGPTASEDVLVIHAEAFDRDKNGEDFSIGAIIAHECGHQLLYRHSRITRFVKSAADDTVHEVLASILGSLIALNPADSEHLELKALEELTGKGVNMDKAMTLLRDLRKLMGALL